MEYMGNKQFWDGKFAARGEQPLSPETALTQQVGKLKKGSVVDVACGDGRNSLFLLEQGFHVTGMDFSQIALERLTNFASQRSQEVATLQSDLSQEECFQGLGQVDNAVINHYRLHSNQIKELSEHITKDGVLFICGFGHNHKWDDRIRKEDLIQKEDFKDIEESFELIHYEETEDSRGFFVTYIFKKK